jgi:dTDP-4-dehydrorhamnose reductase
MPVLITGGKGQLGRELQRAFRLHTDPPEVLEPDIDELDVTEADAVEQAVQRAKPHLVIHAAALTDTSRCEQDIELAMRVNGEGSLNVAEACRRAGAGMVYISTNEVFDGARGEPYAESDEPRPVNAYGRSKLEGERLVRETLLQHYVVRTAWLYAEGGNNFPAKVLRAAEGGRELSMVTDEVATPTWARDLAQAIVRLVALRPSGQPAYGTYHLTNDGWCSRYEWASEVLRLAGRLDVTLRPITMAEYGAGQPAGRVGPPKPPFTALRNEAAARLGITMRPWQEALGEYFSLSTDI